MKPLYEPKGRAKEYGDYCVNIYTGCNHGCTYCFAPAVLHRSKEAFHANVQPRVGLMDALDAQLSSGAYAGKLVHLCFTCDPYPADIDTDITRRVIALLKAHGCHVQILTKGGKRAERDFDLLDGDDWFGVTYTGHAIGELFTPVPAEPNAASHAERLHSLAVAHKAGIKTWMSCEPVLDAHAVYDALGLGHYVDLFRIGKLNYHPSDIDWAEFGRRCEREARMHGANIYIKHDLRAEMEATR